MSYISEAAELFQSFNPETSVLSSFDYLIIAEWEKQEIPLPLVLDAIREFFAKPDHKNPATLDEIKQDVKDLYTVWLCGPDPTTSAPRLIR